LFDLATGIFYSSIFSIAFRPKNLTQTSKAYSGIELPQMPSNY
jgi:hypothetical protein